jgi:hypothetical protein
MDINNALITSGISLGGFSLYKIINHYRLKSSCNSNNELVISVVDVDNKPVVELKEIVVSGSAGSANASNASASTTKNED